MYKETRDTFPKIFRIIHDFEPQDQVEMGAKFGDIVVAVGPPQDDWLFAYKYHDSNIRGYVPAGFVEEVSSPPNRSRNSRSSSKHEKSKHDSSLNYSDEKRSNQPNRQLYNQPKLRSINDLNKHSSLFKRNESYENDDVKDTNHETNTETEDETDRNKPIDSHHNNRDSKSFNYSSTPLTNDTNSLLHRAHKLQSPEAPDRYSSTEFNEQNNYPNENQIQNRLSDKRIHDKESENIQKEEDSGTSFPQREYPPPFSFPLSAETLDSQQQLSLAESLEKYEQYFQHVMKNREQVFRKLEHAIISTAQEIKYCQDKNQSLSQQIQNLDSNLNKEKGKWTQKIDEANIQSLTSQ
eukprot:gb/GECH01014912.1/.p1 GENE.gb/GECH01014912.1/~~gb/GECH01014912.1/.p1  ORF type:complete len:351 (+),score=92.79 gb/GECH01014912.1/:1-1053(+)